MFASLLGVLGVLALVLGLLLLALRYLKRFAPGGAGADKVPLEVVQRLSLSPKQGIAIVRIGERLVAVSMGDGGVRALVELDAPAAQAAATSPLSLSPTLRRSAPAIATQAPAAAVVANALPADFRNLLRTALRSSTTLALLAALLLPTVAAAQGGAPSAAQMDQAIKQATGMVGGAGSGAKAAPGGNAAASQKGAADQLSALVKQATQGTRGGKNANAKGAALSADNEGDDPIGNATPSIDLRVGGGGGAGGSGGLRLSGTVGVVVMMGLLTLLPTLVLMMTGFTRILVVLHFLRQAIGTQSAPPAQLIAALALLITGFVMSPTLTEVNRTALQPWMDGKIEQGEMLTEGVKPFRTFMLRQVRPSDLTTFASISGQQVAGGPQDAPLVVLVAAFVTSELRTAFQIGFALFLPFIVIDVVVASVLMSMGMMMLPPAMISLPFKLLLFVLVDGWALIVTGLVQSFH
ncbi:MAG: flagellar type III secretion system pore protein FliP [Gemmatimonadota bacterium]|nr:flagellar type III secretion system pore protein FliP [Gemmatimonadota bacterium]